MSTATTYMRLATPRENKAAKLADIFAHNWQTNATSYVVRWDSEGRNRLSCRDEVEVLAALPDGNWTTGDIDEAADLSARRIIRELLDNDPAALDHEIATTHIVGNVSLVVREGIPQVLYTIAFDVSADAVL